MIRIAFLILFSRQYLCAQDNCSRDETRRYDELSTPITEYHHENGLLSHRYIKRGEDRLKTLEWNSCGQLIRKIISGKTIRKTPYSKHLSFDYHPNGQLKTKRFVKMVGCLHIKRSRRKEYSETGKRIRKKE